MARTYNQAEKARIKRLRRGSRVIGLAAIQRTGAGAHTPKNEKRAMNARNDWRKEWDYQ